MVVFVPHVPPSPPSPEAQELGLKIAELVRILREENPKIGPQDVRQGLALAGQNLRPEIGGGAGQRVVLIISLLVGMLVLGVFFATTQGQSLDIPWRLVAIGVVVVVLAGVAVLRR